MEHIRIEPQPEIPPDGWELHEQDVTGQWFRPRSSGIYPLFDPPAPGLTHQFCEEHQQMEWRPDELPSTN